MNGIDLEGNTPKHLPLTLRLGSKLTIHYKLIGPSSLPMSCVCNKQIRLLTRRSMRVLHLLIAVSYTALICSTKIVQGNSIND